MELKATEERERLTAASTINDLKRTLKDTQTEVALLHQSLASAQAEQGSRAEWRTTRDACIMTDSVGVTDAESSGGPTGSDTASTNRSHLEYLFDGEVSRVHGDMTEVCDTAAQRQIEVLTVKVESLLY